MAKKSIVLCLVASFAFLIYSVEAIFGWSSHKVPQTVQVFHVNNVQATKELHVSSFKWSSCSGPNASVTLTKLELPDIITLPGVIAVSFAASLRRDVIAPVKAAVHVQKKVSFLWVDIPCVENIGSCTYDDLCSIIPYPPSDPCPDFFQKANLPCHCPAQKGDYTVEKGEFPVPSDPLPAFLEKGQYSVWVNVGSGGDEVICLKLFIELA